MPERCTTSAVIRAGLALAVAISCTATTARAQSAYVGASVLADIARFGTAGGFGGSSGGEAFGGAVRAGTAITDRWGLDLEFVRPGELEGQGLYYYAAGIRAGIAPALAMPGMPAGVGRAGSALPAPTSIFPSTTERYSTLTVMPWIRQALGSRADIVYLGGIAFVRTTSRTDFDGRIGILGSVIDLGQPSVIYGAAPAVGADVRVSMTDHLRLVPGIRLLVVDQGGRRGWLTRPSIGLQWAF